MASLANDGLSLRTLFGAINYYDNQRSLGSSKEKCWAAMSGGHNYDPISHQPVRFLHHLRSGISADGVSVDMLSYSYLIRSLHIQILF